MKRQEHEGISNCYQEVGTQVTSRQAMTLPGAYIHLFEQVSKEHIPIAFSPPDMWALLLPWRNLAHTSNSACATQPPLAPASLLSPPIPIKKAEQLQHKKSSEKGTLSSNTNQCLPDFGITGHFILRVVNIHCILNDCTILIDFNLLCHSSDGKVVTVSVKLNTEKQKHRLRTL